VSGREPGSPASREAGAESAKGVRPVPARRALGASGEDLAAGWYAAEGYQVLDRNWRCREGELDLVLRRRDVVVFCEVKARRGPAFGTPAEAVVASKQRRIRLLALRWLEAHPGVSGELRFDVAAVEARRGYRPVVEVVEAAF
jgi:putative endonuclease